MKKNNNHYKKFSPARQYDFVREGKKDVVMDNDIKQYIIDETKDILKILYPEYLQKETENE